MKNQKHYTSMQLKSLKIKAEEMQTKKYLKKKRKNSTKINFGGAIHWNEQIYIE